jgi:hypothetical protein
MGSDGGDANFYTATKPRLDGTISLHADPRTYFQQY